MNADSPYHPELDQHPFYLGRHGESFGNADELSQGRGEDKPNEPNGLTPAGVLQVELAAPALVAAGIYVQHVSSSTLTRAKESADAFVRASIEPKPVLIGEVAPNEEDGLKEISQKGWEGVHARERTKQLRKEKLARFMGELSLTGKLDQKDIEDYASWVMRLGGEGENQGESPLGGALRGISALEKHGVRPGELVFSHAMLNRYMDAIATTVGSEGRERLRHILEDRSIPETAMNIALIKALKELGVKDFKTHDNPANRQANGGVTEYTVDHTSGQWVAGRRIEPPKPGSEHAYIEHWRNAQAGKWERIAPGGNNSDNE
ncbi:MAG TPA: histidine phosphatase family protein [Candidatus Saccharimonadales bacterium]|nr:histidine phosphatase family protein [Candidatus Saccharimonadales bacterium]